LPLYWAVRVHSLVCQRRGPAHLADWPIQEEITVYRSAPRVFRHQESTLLARKIFLSFCVIVLAGEAVHKTDFDLYKKHFSPDCLLLTLTVHMKSDLSECTSSGRKQIAERCTDWHEIPDEKCFCSMITDKR
jgi:hypothetical protein